MLENLKNCPLFSGMSEEDVSICLACSGSDVRSYEKDDIVFYQKDEPTHLLVLIEGTVAVCNDTATGKRSIVTIIEQRGELFGEVFVFLNRREFDHYAQALTAAKVLRLPRDFLSYPSTEHAALQGKLISNMLAILAQKAYFLNQKVQILSCATLRQKIASIFLRHCDADGKVMLSMNREALADFLNTARPSLSRELMSMQEEGMIQIQKREIYITDLNAMQNIL